MSHIPKITLCFIGRRDRQFTVNNTLNFYKENYVLHKYFPLAFHGFRCILNLYKYDVKVLDSFYII